MSDLEEETDKVRRRRYHLGDEYVNIAPDARKWFVVILFILAVAAGAAWIGYAVFKAREKSVVQKLLVEAKQYTDKKDWRDAQLCLRRIFQINPANVAATKLAADLLEAEGSPSALTWRIRVANLETNNATNLFLWAKAALKAENLKSAKLALAAIDEQSKATAEYHKLAGALAWSQGRTTEADEQYMEALRLEPDNPANVLNLATIRLVSTNQAIAANGRLLLEQVVTNETVGLVALHRLLSDAIARHDLSKAVEYAREILHRPAAVAADKVVYLQLLHEAGSTDYAPWLASLKTSAIHSPEDAAAVGRWMADTEKPGTTLSWLLGLPRDIQTNQAVRLVITDCQMAAKDWPGLLAFVGKQNWGETTYYQMAIESLAERSSGNDIAFENDWNQTMLLSAGRLDRLTRLAKITEVWGWQPENTKVLHQITDQFPKEKWAADKLMAQLYTDGNTEALQDLILKLRNADPGDVRLKSNLAIILLLRKKDLNQANLLAKEAYDASPGNPYFISTYAYSLLSQRDKHEALKVLGGLKPEDLKIPSVAAYYGVIQAAAGHVDLARESLARAATAKLLPEEEEMIRQVTIAPPGEEEMEEKIRQLKLRAK